MPTHVCIHTIALCTTGLATDLVYASQRRLTFRCAGTEFSLRKWGSSRENRVFPHTAAELPPELLS